MYVLKMIHIVHYEILVCMFRKYNKLAATWYNETHNTVQWTVQWDTKHGTMRHTIRYNETHNTVQWDTTRYNETHNTVQWDTQYGTMRHTTRYNEPHNTVQWDYNETQHGTMRHTIRYNSASRYMTTCVLRQHKTNLEISAQYVEVSSFLFSDCPHVDTY